jgi:tRNA threonylcarbamoyl adenosine modification protein YjeE
MGEAAPMNASWRLSSARATEGLGRALAGSCPWDRQQPRLVFLSGELGAGKTTLAAALLQALGVEETVRSPSYALIETYRARAGEAVHIDLYRLAGANELHQLGVRDYLNGDTLLLVEWPERAGGALPGPDLLVRLEPLADPAAGREARVEARSKAGESWLRAAMAALPSQI